MITVLCGGVGAARFLRGLIDVVPESDVVAVVNTADDVVLHGLHVSPDLDTVVYTLAGAIDPDRGWGLADETWRTMAELAKFVAVRPAGSNAAPTWFNLGDRDLATHMYRTGRLAEGAGLAAVTTEIAVAHGLGIAVVPMTEDRVATMVTLEEPGRPEISFQEYFVERRHAVPVHSVRFDGAETATAFDLGSLRASDVVVIAPSNPLVSIGPIRSLAGVDDTLVDIRERVVAVSPIVGGAALKGPADRLLSELGHESSVAGVARLYAPVCATLVIDEIDAHHAQRVEAEGMRCVVAPTVMSTPAIAAALARTVIGSASTERAT
jgi:LPPG:FO 2-phospho-L-lactate transferase